MLAFLSYSQRNTAEAEAVHERLSREPDIVVTWDALDLPTFGSPKSFMESVRDHDAVVHLISAPFLESLNCMRELLAFMKDDTQRTDYLRRTIPIIITSAEDDPDLFNTMGQLRVLDYWMARKTELEEQINSRTDFGAALDEVRKELTLLRDVAEHIMRFMRTVTENIYATSYVEQQGTDFADVLRRLREIGNASGNLADSMQRASSSGLRSRFSRVFNNEDSSALAVGAPAAVAVTSLEGGPVSGERELLVSLRDGIVVGSESDPERPEFPPFSPRFPATPSYPLTIPGLEREIILKDESYNFTGSHKDRMAREMVVYYKELIQDLLSPHARSLRLPCLSIISNGSAALAIQIMLRCYGLPSLKVLVDEEIDEHAKRQLERAGCSVYVCNLAARVLDSADVLRLTDNESGHDITARDLVDPNKRRYYDWLAYEILNCGASHLFIPVGTGDLYLNVLTVLRDELISATSDPRLKVPRAAIEGLGLYGATSSNPATRMDKLYAKYRPMLEVARRVVREMRDGSLCGPSSDVYDVSEGAAAKALDVARANGVLCDESGIAGLSLALQWQAEQRLPLSGKVLVVNTGWLSAQAQAASPRSKQRNRGGQQRYVATGSDVHQVHSE